MSQPSSIALVKVIFPEEQLQKAMTLDLTIKISEVRQAIIDKRQEGVPIKLPAGEQLWHYGLYCPPTANASGQWMRDGDSLNDYNISKSVSEMKLFVLFFFSQDLEIFFGSDFSITRFFLLSWFAIG